MVAVGRETKWQGQVLRKDTGNCEKEADSWKGSSESGAFNWTEASLLPRHFKEGEPAENVGGPGQKPVTKSGSLTRFEEEAMLHMAKICEKYEDVGKEMLDVKVPQFCWPKSAPCRSLRFALLDHIS